MEALGPGLQGDLDWIGPILDKWMPRLGLDNWTVTIHLDYAIVMPGGDEINATVSVNESDGFSANIHISRWMLDQEPEEQERVLLHELVHLLLWDMSEYAVRSLDEERQEWFRRETEQAVGHLTRVLTRMATPGPSTTEKEDPLSS